MSHLNDLRKQSKEFKKLNSDEMMARAERREMPRPKQVFKDQNRYSRKQKFHERNDE